MQKDAFAVEVRALRDELERRKKAAEQAAAAAAAAEGKPLSAAPSRRPGKQAPPPEPVTAFFCLICGEGSAGTKPHRCLVEEAELAKKKAAAAAAGKR
ncbi:hypothetical protein E8A74_45895 [Polyangium fumosum]|uniref:Uncharacterized protein n=1 Tax=Polyangium fumosum TaxID=889272 RepID=A0A4V5PKR5_9BACT|nr:hypothetical protein E8A74_45895 [Polyangium fumosum]